MMVSLILLHAVSSITYTVTAITDTAMTLDIDLAVAGGATS